MSRLPLNIGGQGLTVTYATDLCLREMIAAAADRDRPRFEKWHNRYQLKTQAGDRDDPELWACVIRLTGLTPEVHGILAD